MNTRVRIRALALVASVAMMHAAQTDEHAAQGQNTAAAITADVGNIVNTAATLVQHHDKQTILASVGQLLNSIFSIIASLVHKHEIVPAEEEVVVAAEQVADDQQSDEQEAIKHEAAIAQEEAEEHEGDQAQEDVQQPAVAKDAHAEILATPIIVELSQEQLDLLIAAILSAREELHDASLHELGNALQEAEKEAAQEQKRRSQADAQQTEDDQNVIEILNALIHDLFAIIQNSGSDAHALGESIADMLGNIVELAVDTIKYEQLDHNDIETCAAAYIDRVCTELNRQIRHLMVQSALTLRGSMCSIACCKQPARPCAAAIAMITGNRDAMNMRSNCPTCCRPSTCSSCSSCNTSTNRPCCNNRSAMMEEELRCPCNRPKPAPAQPAAPKEVAPEDPTPADPETRSQDDMMMMSSRHIIVKCPCLQHNKPKQTIAQDADASAIVRVEQTEKEQPVAQEVPAHKPKLHASQKQGNRIIPEVYRSKKAAC